MANDSLKKFEADLKISAAVIDACKHLKEVSDATGVEPRDLFKRFTKIFWADEKESFVNYLDVDNVRNTIAANIAAYRKKNKLSRAELAEKIGVTVATIGQYERAERTPIIENLCWLSNYFGISIDKFVRQSLHMGSEYREN